MTRSVKDDPVGRIVGLWRYPVKSMAGEALTEADVSWQGIDGDRRWAFVRNHREQSGFPWLTLRQRAELGHYRPSFVDPAHPNKSRTVVETPSGTVLDVTDSALGKELDSEGVRVIRSDRGVFDTFPLSLITTQTLRQLGQAVGTELDVRRFRPNILVEATGDDPYPEDSWVGRVLRLGGLRLRVDERDQRCVVITIDPETHERNPEISRTVSRDRQGCLGVYGSTVEPGRIAVGDSVSLDSPD